MPDSEMTRSTDAGEWTACGYTRLRNSTNAYICLGPLLGNAPIQ